MRLHYLISTGKGKPTAGKTNRQISDKPPAHYFPDIVGKSGIEPFAAQCIPMEEPLLVIGSYKAFLHKRRELITASLNKYLGV